MDDKHYLIKGIKQTIIDKTDELNKESKSVLGALIHSLSLIQLNNLHKYTSKLVLLSKEIYDLTERLNFEITSVDDQK